MKKKYVKPTAIGESFVANEYVAVCGKKDGKYIFTCDAPGGNLYYYTVDAKGNKTKHFVSITYHPCDKKHVTEGPSGYYDGFVDYNKNRNEDPGEAVLVWLEKSNVGKLEWISNAHASASLTREQIEVERS